MQMNKTETLTVFTVYKIVVEKTDNRQIKYTVEC